MGYPIEPLDPDPEGLFAPGEVSSWAKPRLSALRRRWRRVLFVTALFVGLAVAALKSWPKSYRSTAVLFAMPAEDAPGALRGPAGGIEGLAKGAARVVVREDALRKRVRALGLAPSWAASRRGASAWLDRGLVWLGLEHPADTPEDRAIAALKDRLKVTVDHAEVKIVAEWPDPKLAHAIAESTSQALIALRRRTEIAPLEAKATALSAEAARDARKVDQAAAALSAQIQAKHEGMKASTVRGLQAQGRFRDLPDPNLARLRRELISKRKAISELKSVQQKRLADLTATLAELRATLGPKNPRVLDTQDQIRALAGQGKELEALEAQAQALLARYVQAGGNARELSTDPGALFAPMPKEDDAVLEFRKQELALDLGRLNEVRDEVLQAEVAVSAAEAAFAGRYLELESPEVPRHPCSPRPALVCFSALVAGLLLGSLWAISLELAKRP